MLIKINPEMYTGLTYSGIAVIIALALYGLALYLNNFDWRKTLSITLASIASVVLILSSFVIVMIVSGF